MRKKGLVLVLVLLISSTIFFGCFGQTIAQKDQKENYKGRVFYEIFVRAFNDSNGDGIGDLKGITQKLDYLSKDLGVTGIWLMPINPSPSYHGYDVTDYYGINPEYGTIEDLKELLKEAHKRNIKVVMDLVVNHSSKEHVWFKEALKSKDSEYRDYYIWADENTDISEGSAISAQPWIPIGNEHYYALFWEGMPDLNLDNKKLREEIKNIAKSYLDIGMDGFRLDAAMHVYKETDKNLQWWKEFNDYIKSQNKDAILVGEIWEKTPTIAEYFKSLDSTFNFPVGEAILSMVKGGSVGNGSFVMGNAYAQYADKAPNYIDSPFLTNHDQNRVMSVLNDVEKAKKAAAIYLTLPGTPYIYYGEEIGMTGVKPDEKIREPFIWDNKDISKNSKWIESTNDLNKVAANVQLKDKDSLLNFYKTIIGIRNSNDAIKYGNIELLETESSDILSFKRTKDKKSVYIYVNLGDTPANEKIDLGKAKVLYSNKRNKNSLNLKGTIGIKDNEILILEKK